MKKDGHWPDEASIVIFAEGDPNENPWVNGKPKQEEIEVEDFSPLWAEMYEVHKAQIETAIPESALSLEHIGSTAVQGLPAKPVIDIDLIVADPEREDEYVPALEALGYELTVRERLGAGIRDSGLMISQPYHLYVERSDASRNMARYYAMSIEPNLFGDISCGNGAELEPRDR